MTRILVAVALLCGACTHEPPAPAPKPPLGSLRGKLAGRELATCPEGWEVKPVDQLTVFTCDIDLWRVASVEIETTNSGRIAHIEISGPDEADVTRSFDQMSPLLSPELAERLRPTIHQPLPTPMPTRWDKYIDFWYGVSGGIFVLTETPRHPLYQIQWQDTLTRNSW